MTEFAELLDKVVAAAVIAGVGMLWKIGHELTKLRIIISNMKQDIAEMKDDIDEIEDDIDELGEK